MRISPEVEIALSVAAHEATRRRHAVVGLEHLLHALLLNDATAAVVEHAGGDVHLVKERLETFIGEQGSVPDGAVTPVSSFPLERAIQRAGYYVKSSGREEITAHHVVVAIFAERDSFAVSALEQSGTTRLGVVSYVSHGISKRAEAEPPRVGAPGDVLQVVVHNDDFSTMEFVVKVLGQFFHKTRAESTDIMLAVHQKGRGIAGVYTRDVAETKVGLVNSFARDNGMPLLVTAEPEPE